MAVLVIGRNVEVLETVKGGLIAKGIAADGTDAERASIDFDARNFAVVAIGGGVASHLRETLKGDFRRQNPDVILLDTFAPVAVPHIAAALRCWQARVRIPLRDCRRRRIVSHAPGFEVGV